MFSIVVVCMVLATASADKVDSSTLKSFQSTFYGTIMQHLQAEYMILKPELDEHNQTMVVCMQKIETAQRICRSCAERECKPSVGDWIEGKWTGMTDWFQGAGHSFAGWKGWHDVGGFFGDMGNWFSGAGNSFVNWKGWNSVDNFFSNVGSGFGDFFGNFGKTFGSIGKGFGKGFGKLFGRKRRDTRENAMTRRFKITRTRYVAKRMTELDPEVRECMEKCTECSHFLGDQDAMIAGVCGEQVLMDERRMVEVMTKLKAFHDANGNPQQGTTPILSMIEYDKSTFDFASFTCGGVYVTAMTPDGVVRYPSEYRYNLQFPQITATELAMELIEKWEV